MLKSLKDMHRPRPLLRHCGVYLAFQILSSLRYKLVIMDVSSAFGKSDSHETDQGPPFASMPSSGVPGYQQTCLIRVLTAVYGRVNAPAVWRRTDQGGNERHRDLMEALRAKFNFGKWREIYESSGEYLGRTVYQMRDYRCTSRCSATSKRSSSRSC